MFASFGRTRRRVHRIATFILLAIIPAQPALAGFNLTGGKWGSPVFGTGATVTWSLMPTGATSGDSTSIVALEDFMPVGFKSEIEAAFDAWSEVADITFIEVTDTDPNNGDIRIGGHPIPGSVLAHANFPGTGPTPGDVHFDTLVNWAVGAAGGVGIKHVAVHEIGHSIGLAHATNTVAIMNPTISGAFPGLFPDDIAGAQLIYGPAPGYPPPPPANAQLTLTSNSFIEVNITALGGQVDITDSASIEGTLDARIIHDSPGVASTFSVKSAALQAGDMMFAQSGTGFDVSGDITDTAGFLISNLEAAVGSAGEFDFGGTQFGIIDGVFSFEATVLGSTVGDAFNFFDTPTAFPLEGVGSIAETPSGVPGQYDALVQYPISTSVDLTFDVEDTEIEVQVTITGLIEATGVVPEPSTWVLSVMGLGALLVLARRRSRKVMA